MVDMKPLQVSDAATVVLALQEEIQRSEESRYDHRLHGLLMVAGFLRALDLLCEPYALSRRAVLEPAVTH